MATDLSRLSDKTFAIFNQSIISTNCGNVSAMGILAAKKKTNHAADACQISLVVFQNTEIHIELGA